MKDFSHQNLKGRNFSKEDLSNADFSFADIRGANFTDANLQGANFTHAKAGQRNRWIFSLAFGTLILSAITGFILAYAGGLIGSLVIADDPIVYGPRLITLGSSFVTLLLLLAFIFVVVKQGLRSALTVFVTIITVIVALAAAGSEIDTLAAALVLQALAIFIAVSGVLAGALALTVAQLITEKPFLLYLTITVAVIAATFGGLEGVESTIKTSDFLENLALFVTGIISILLLFLCVFISRAAIAKDHRYPLTRASATAISVLGGTSFRCANLTDSDFTQAILGNVDLRVANITRTDFSNAKGLSRARVGRTYLEDEHIQKLVISKYGKNSDFTDKKLRGINLQNANLSGAVFLGADLSSSNLQNANLLKATLVRAQLYQANLTGASFTGAYIEDWGISTDTLFDDVECKYVYMRLPTPEDPDPCRKPDNRQEVFEKGEFVDFIAPIVKTLDLYRRQNVDLRSVADTYKTIDLFHHSGIDPSAAALALKRLAEQNPEAGIEVVALEGRGDKQIRLQAKVKDKIDRSELSAQYFQSYNQLKTYSYEDLRALLSGFEKRDQQMMQRFTEMLKTVIQQPKVYMEVREFIMSQSKGNININDVQGNVSGVTAAGETQNISGSAIGEISGTITNKINQLSDSSGSDEAGIKELLAQLQAVIESEPELNNEDKSEALIQVGTLAEASQRPEDNLLKKSAKTAMKILKGTAASLPHATKLVEEFNKLLPSIATLLALV